MIKQNNIFSDFGATSHLKLNGPTLNFKTLVQGVPLDPEVFLGTLRDVNEID